MVIISTILIVINARKTVYNALTLQLQLKIMKIKLVKNVMQISTLAVMVSVYVQDYKIFITINN